MTTTLHVLDWVGGALGLLGAYLLAFRMSASRYGWVAFFAANLAYIAMAHQLGVTGLLLQQVGFLGSSAIGIYRHFLAGMRPSAAAVQTRRDDEASWAISSRLAALALLRPDARSAQLEQLLVEARALHTDAQSTDEHRAGPVHIGRAEDGARRVAGGPA
jgi:hypothetical protein